MLKVEIPEAAWRLYTSRYFRLAHWFLLIPALGLLVSVLPAVGFVGSFLCSAFVLFMILLLIRYLARLVEVFSKGPPHIVLEMTNEHLTINLEERTTVDLASIDKLTWDWLGFFFLNLLVVTIHHTDGSFRKVRSQAASSTIRRAVDLANQRIAS